MFTFTQASKKLKILGIFNLVVLIVLVLRSSTFSPEYFVLTATCYLVFFLVCIFRIAIIPGKDTSQISLPISNLVVNSFQILQHWLLPILQLIGFWATIFWIKYPLLQILLTIVQSFISFVFLTNFRAYLNQAHLLELKSHYIYDLMTLLTVFYGNFAVFTFGLYFGLANIFIILGSFLIMLIIFIADGLRFLPEQKIRIVLLLLPVLIVIYGCFFINLISPIKSVLFLTLVSYLLLNYFHHWLIREHKNLSLLWEYLLIIAIAVIIVLQISI